MKLYYVLPTLLHGVKVSWGLSQYSDRLRAGRPGFNCREGHIQITWSSSRLLPNGYRGLFARG